MASIVRQNFNAVATNLTTCPTNEALLHAQKIEEGVYKIYGVLYAPSSTTDFHVEHPSVADLETEAGDITARSFVITATVQSQSDTTYGLWAFEIVYNLEDSPSEKYESVKVALTFPEPGPETTRGTVTTVRDPEHQ